MRLLFGFGLIFLFLVLGAYLVSRFLVERSRAAEDRRLCSEVER